MILAVDLGGTKCVMALYRPGAMSSVRERIYKCAEHGSLDEIVADFLKEPPPELLIGACFAVAGPIHGRTAKITNLPWTIDADALSQRIGAPLELLNDLQATALGMLVLPTNRLAILQSGARMPESTIAVIAPGTGLGEAMLVSENGKYRALPSEGGHADFAPTTDEEIDLLRFLRRKYGNHVSNERVLCGNGIGDLYDFVRAVSEPEPGWLTAEMVGKDRNAVISDAGLARTDAACVRALEMFAEILGAEAGNQVLRMMATGGVVIGGGIPPRILTILQDGRLIARFCEKGRFAPWMKSLSVRVSLEPRAALLGAAYAVMEKQS